MHSITLNQLANIHAHPDDLEGYLDACAAHCLNGVDKPFWQDWSSACTSVFLILEALHHWHKEFFDHDCQWCIVAVGVQELDFQFSILQLITGYHHYSGGILKLKQVTGRVHRNIQCYNCWSHRRCSPSSICALMDVHYMAQSPSPDENLLASIDKSLSTFHANKDAIMTLGAQMGMKKPINNWFIPKLELMQSITASTRKVGALFQWSADATKNAHICCHLDRQEKLQQFAIAMTLKSRVLDLGIKESSKDEGDNEEVDEHEELSTDSRIALLEQFNCTRITTKYFSKAKTSAYWFACRKFPFTIPALSLPAQTLHASPLGPGWPKGRRDAVLINVDKEYEWPQSGLNGHAVCELRDIKTIQYDKTGPPAYSNGEWKFHCKRKQAKRTCGATPVIESEDDSAEDDETEDGRTDVDETGVKDTGALMGASLESMIPGQSEQETWGSQEYQPGSKKRCRQQHVTTEKEFQRLFYTIQYHLHHKLKTHLPFNIPVKMRNHEGSRYWSAEFTTSPIPDTYNCQKPKIALFDFALKDMKKTWADVLSFVEHTSSNLAKKRDIPVFWGSMIKAYLIMREQPWR
ncbi:hypothetical protein DFJ58DRAFT_728859 [Suillus subalutaceus]|uniref:uncharacterized protein n=1 Tax=Suillus subalutaceus TaxID=48586 RepID=UPI001B88597D|nr:uncharacterized protein DFJ58DRAFT_728859 [Suillus subalutaceus]KAG1851419.1 hypothetical protein DFJ58DRAFT_728859 [Suillus subalutaceus]